MKIRTPRFGAVRLLFSHRLTRRGAARQWRRQPAYKTNKTEAINLHTLLPREKSKRLIALFAVGLVLSAAVPILAQISGIWAKTGSMNSQRQYHTLTLLPNGQVLAAGGGAH
jgi:hypothetical protein